MRFKYNSQTKTLYIHSSEDDNSYISLASLEPEEFLSFDSDIEKAFVEKQCDSSLFQTGIKFIQGFLPSDEQNKKFLHMFINDGILFGANGISKIGAFKSDDFNGLTIMIRGAMLNPINALLEKIDTTNVDIKTTSKFVFICSPDGNYGFGFRKSTDEMVKMPISLEDPKTPGFAIERNSFLKKLNKLAIISPEIGVNAKVENNTIRLETITERKSSELLACKQFTETEGIVFNFEYKLIKLILGLFQTPTLSIFVDKTKCTITSQATLEITSDSGEIINKPFKTVAVMCLARII
jgi:hypothetical protein